MIQTLVQIVVALLTATCVIFFLCAILGLILGEIINITKYIGGMLWKRQSVQKRN